MNMRSGRLVVTVDPPNQGWANNNRFDRTGAVVSVVLDGKHTFTTPEVLSTKRFTTGGMGLMAEFLWQDPIDCAGAGQRYHKVGVGMVERGAEEVNMVSAFTANCVPNESSLDQDGEDAAVFTSRAPMHAGWAYAIERRVQVTDNRLIMTATLSNQGEKPMAMLEYNHNFVNINDRPIGPEYRIELSYDLTLNGSPSGVIRQDGKVYTFTGQPDKPFFLTTEGIGEAEVYGWKMTHAQDGVTISEKVSDRPGRTAMWGIEHVASVEVFVPIHLAPGQSKTWTREWTFED